MNLIDAIIVDVDGTFANNEHRRPFVEKQPKDWKSYLALVDKDTVYAWCNDLVQAMVQAETLPIFVTGRDESHRVVTENLIRRSGIREYELHMRACGDYRQDAIVKRELFDKHIAGKFNIKFAIDDRQQVVDLWRSMGIVCLQCAPGDF